MLAMSAAAAAAAPISSPNKKPDLYAAAAVCIRVRPDYFGCAKILSEKACRPSETAAAQNSSDAIRASGLRKPSYFFFFLAVFFAFLAFFAFFAILPSV